MLDDPLSVSVADKARVAESDAACALASAPKPAPAPTPDPMAGSRHHEDGGGSGRMRRACAILVALMLAACQTTENVKPLKPPRLGAGNYVLLVQVVLNTAKLADTVMYPFPSFKKCEDAKYRMVSMYKKKGHHVTLAECRGKLSA